MKNSSLTALTVFVAAFSLILAPVSAAPEKKDDNDKKIEEAQKKAEAELNGSDPQRSKVIEEGKQNLAEIRKMLEKIQNDLSNKQTGSSTQNQQKKVVSKMNQLIEKIAEECERCNKGGQGKPDPNQQKLADKQNQNGQQKPGQEKPQGQKRENQKQVSSSRQQQEKQQQEKQRLQQDVQKEKKSGKVENTKVADGKLPKGEGGELVNQLYKEKKWGQLPPKIRDAIFSASSKPAPHEYRRIIDSYYLKISSQYTKKR